MRAGSGNLIKQLPTRRALHVCRTENGVDAGPGNLDFQTVADVVDVGQSGTLRRVGFLPRTPKTTATSHGAGQGRAMAVFAFDLQESLRPSDQTQHHKESWESQATCLFVQVQGSTQSLQEFP